MQNVVDIFIYMFEFGAMNILFLWSTNLAHFLFLFDNVTMQCMLLVDLTGLNVKILCIIYYKEQIIFEIVAQKDSSKLKSLELQE